MRFRPCIDIHNGKVKQIIGGSLQDGGDFARENFVSGQDAAFFAGLYRQKELSGGHVILLNPQSSPYYESTRKQAMAALAAWPGGLQAGGGITAENAADYIEAGASHVIVTSYVFKDGRIHEGRLQRLVQKVGKKRLVLDLSCRKREDQYYIVTDRWQKFTSVRVNGETLARLAGCCDEFLVHAVDVEGKSAGPEEELVSLLAGSPVPATYAGGVGSLEDIARLKALGKGRVDVTIGSALTLFGGSLSLDEVLLVCGEQETGC